MITGQVRGLRVINMVFSIAGNDFPYHIPNTSL